MRFVVFAVLSVASSFARTPPLVDPGDLNEKDFKALYACIAGCGIGHVSPSVCESQCYRLFGSNDDGRAKMAQACPNKKGKALGECMYKVGSGPERSQSAELQPSAGGAAR